MQLHTGSPQQVTAGWAAREYAQPAGEEVGFHFHEVEEWLTVLGGDVTFHSAADIPFRVSTGQSLRIPRGEVHRVHVGPDGVVYEMRTPVPVPEEAFQQWLDPEEIELVRENLMVPGQEDAGSTAFFSALLSSDLVFRTAGGALLDRDGFLARGFVDRKRRSDGSVQVLHRTAAPWSLLVATGVLVPGEGGFTNVRLFVREEDRIRCRIWLNYPDPVLATSAQAAPAPVSG